mmetsp:Transcript_119722/g.382130  ORF Transcript_119722/g.382130 Transcript_119722/m.382130 type:complete len:297 (-) Transcript_119722:1378-2268(-)
MGRFLRDAQHLHSEPPHVVRVHRTVSHHRAAVLDLLAEVEEIVFGLGIRGLVLGCCLGLCSSRRLGDCCLRFRLGLPRAIKGQDQPSVEPPWQVSVADLHPAVALVVARHDRPPRSSAHLRVFRTLHAREAQPHIGLQAAVVDHVLPFGIWHRLHYRNTVKPRRNVLLAIDLKPITLHDTGNFGAPLSEVIHRVILGQSALLPAEKQARCLVQPGLVHQKLPGLWLRRRLFKLLQSCRDRQSVRGSRANWSSGGNSSSRLYVFFTFLDGLAGLQRQLPPQRISPQAGGLLQELGSG